MNEKGLLETLNTLAPWKCRLLATNGRRPMSTPELAAKAGLSRTRIKYLARLDSWEGIKLGTIVKYTAACGVDLLHQKYPKQRLLRMMQAQRGPAHLSTPQRKYWNSIFTGERNWRKTT